MKISEDNRTAVMSLEEFRGLSEYSCTLPTGQTIGKQWRRRTPYMTDQGGPFLWYLGEYYMDETIPEGEIGIRWCRIVLSDFRQNVALIRGPQRRKQEKQPGSLPPQEGQGA